MISENVERMRIGYEAFQRRDIEAILALLDPAVVIEEAGPDAETRHGHAGMRAFLESFLEPWDYFAIEGLEFTELGDEIVAAVSWRAGGHHSGLEIDTTIYMVWTMRAGKGARLRIFFDHDEAFRAAKGLREGDPPWPG